jgi:hypothetical protein
MTQTIINLGTGGAVLNGRNGSTTGADSNDALFLAWDGTNYVYLPGVSGNFISVPDEAALDITGDIDIRVQVAMDDWTPAAEQTFVSKRAGAGTRSYNLASTTAGALLLSWSENGTDFLTATSTVSTSVSDGTAKWIRATLDVDNGASGYDAKFFLSDDGITWTQLGATVTGGATTSIFSSSTSLRVGERTGNTNPAAGKFYRAQVFNGIDGTKVLDVDTSVITSGAATTFTALTGQTVTINRSTTGRKSVAVVSPVWLFGNDDYIEVADNDLLDFGATDSFTVLAVVRQWDTPLINRALVNKFEATNGWNLRQLTTQFANQGLLVSGGITVADNGPTLVQSNGSLSMHGMLVNRSTQELTAFTDNTPSGSPSNISTVGSVANSVAFRIGGISSGTPSYQNLELVAVAIFRRALSAAEISAITAYYQARLS